MSADAEVVVLSSTPDHSFSCAPQPAPYSATHLFGLSPRPSSPSPVASPSELFRGIQSPTKDLPRTAKTADERVTGNSTLDGNAPENKPKRGRKKATDDKQTILKDPEPTSLERKGNAPKKTTKPRAKRAGTEGKPGGSKNKTLTGRVSKSSNLQSSSQKDTTKGQDGWETDGLQLEEATKRRLDWTPPKGSTGLGGNGSTRRSPESTPTRELNNFLSGYEFTGSTNTQANMQPVEAGDGPTKRRRIELIDSNVPSNSKRGSSNEKSRASSEKTDQNPAPAKKPKKQTKRTTTLTARVTARYAPDYTGDVTDSQQGGATKSAAESKRKSKAKQKPQEPEFVVLSPEAAVKSLQDQDLMFGTCSQLEREDSPTTLRDMQTAINTSESYMKPGDLSRGTSSRSMISRSTTPKNLWSEAFRDLDGDLAQIEVVDLADSCDISQISPRKDRNISDKDERKQGASSVARQQSNTTGQTKTSKPTEIQAEQIPRQVGDSGAKQPRRASSEAEIRPEMPQYGGLTDAELSKQIAAYGFKSVKGRQKMIGLLQKCWESKHGSSIESNGGGKQGSSELSSAKSKKDDSCDPPSHAPSSKPRAKPKAKNQKMAKVVGNPPSDSPPKAAGPIRVSQKPSFVDVEEIEDSEDEAILSPSRLQTQSVHGSRTERTSSQSQPVSSRAPSTPSRAASSKPRNGPLTATVILDSCDEEDDDDEYCNLPDLAVQITKAVQAQRSKSASASSSASAGGSLGRLSWHEKILMYDPIVIEDFATWLNTEGLGLIAEDREVGARFLRAWCESKGICCCYRKDRL